ncbi:transglutaminase-like domain-containing protein [Alloalcanivorax profundimaris]|uniref:transglutaminase-like domain-containing protein n=1 Tax=Alloalcanivorax profundimaris TaxID=2735259 RepID=UPI0018871794|nr:transglutaminase-like domain-containing protein [Alloalcanivorax profundimaris]MBF1803562.1 transglutaminase domain-containing protein [Alloalcanivorax profundimaris]
MTTTMMDRNTSESHAAPAMERMRYARRLCRTTALVAVMMLLNAVIWPSWAVAVEVERQKEAQAQARWEARHQSLDQVLLGIRQEARDGRSMMADTLAERNQGFLGKARSLLGIEQAPAEALPRLQWLSQRAANLHEQALASFDETEAHLRKKELPRRILDRNDRAREEYQRAYATMRETLNQALDSDSLGEQEEAMAALVDFMDRFTLDKPRDPFDPNKLPWRTPDPDRTPTPARSAEALSQRTGLPRFEQGLELASLNNNAALSVAPGAPTDEALAATLDAPQTPAIQAKAAELDHDPVRIYQWVRNNIEFIPSYGSIQGAEYTLELGKGNAFDTASLLIALLRASDIPARYAMGTVRMPADQVMNWVGGVNVPSAAGNLMGQGGIPNTGLTRGGQISHFELEHIWVEAWIDFHPSRGADHRTGDTWVPMDASFKQYQYSEGMDLQDQVPFDAEGLARTIEQESTINEEEGWVQGVPQMTIENVVEGYRGRLEKHLENQNASIKETIGGHDIKKIISKQFSGALPYELVTRELFTNEIPEKLRWRFSYELYDVSYGLKGTAILVINEATAKLAGRKLALSFFPSNKEDEAAIDSYLPDYSSEDAETSSSHSLPGYLIRLSAEFSVDDEIGASSEKAIPLGQGLHSEMGYWSPMYGWETTENRPVSGEYRSIALDLQGVSLGAVNKNKSDVYHVNDKIKREDYLGLNKRDLVGDALYGTINNYFFLNDVQDSVSERASKSVGYRAPSYGVFASALEAEYWFGAPRNVSVVGLAMDVDNMRSIRVDKNNNHEDWVGYNKILGMRMSAMEHLVPEEMYGLNDNVEAFSAVKAMHVAAKEGQRIWQINSQNVDVALSEIKLSGSVRKNIRNSVMAGKEVTAHESMINIQGRKMAGYIVIDPETGSGAYMISSGESGGFLQTALASLLGFLGGLTEGGNRAEPPVFSDRLRKLVKNARYVSVLGAIALFSDALVTLTSSDLGWASKLGRISTAVFAYAATAILTASAFAFAGPVFAAIAGALLAGFLTALLSRFNERYFSKITGNRRKWAFYA